MSKVLYIATWNPFTTGGGAQATRSYLDAILDIFGANNVDVIINKGVRIPCVYKDVTFIEVPKRSKLKSFLSFIFGILGSHAVPTFKLLKHNPAKYNWVVFNGGREAGWCFKRIRHFNIKKVTIHHNYEVEFCVDTKSIYTLGKKWPFTVRHEERNAYKYSDYNLFLTNQDMATFSRIYGKTTAKNSLIGTFDYKDREVEIINDNDKCYDISISGSLVDYQTVVGIQNFFSNYLNLTMHIIPDVKILITGRGPSKPISDIVAAYPDICQLFYNPHDILPLVQNGRIYLCPTCIGGGLKLRAMDGLKCGLPVLVHEVSARGYDYYYDKPYFKIYHDKESFANGLKDILSYLKFTPDSSSQINRDYYEFFGYYKGVERLANILK